MNGFKAWVASLAMLLVVAFGVAVPAYAQDSDIQRGLCTGANLEFTDTPGNCSNNDDANTKISNFIRRVVNLLSAVVGVVAVIMIIVGGLRYITSGGNDTSVTGAKNTILYAIIGLIIVALAQLIVRFTLRQITNT